MPKVNLFESNPVPSIESLATLISGSNVPTLFLDTCNFLDIVRLAIADQYKKGEAEAAMKILKLATESPLSCRIVIASLIRQEWADNIQNVTNEGITHLGKMEKQSSLFHDVCQALGIVPKFGRAGYAGMGLTEDLRDLSKRLIDAAVSIDVDKECRSKAVERVINRIPPASLKSEVKDCTILEEYLAVCRKLKAAGHQGKYVFCTSNKNDYCLGGKLHPQLATEFEDVGLEFTMNLSWALSVMKL